MQKLYAAWEKYCEVEIFQGGRGDKEEVYLISYSRVFLATVLSSSKHFQLQHKLFSDGKNLT